ncbi:MAG: tetratricopeptide repeat protein [candidate division WOR-3 bacterium]
MLIFIITLLLGISANESTSQLIEQAIMLYDTRHQNSINLNRSRELLESILMAEPNNPVAIYRLSQVYFTLGEYAKSKKEKLFWYEKGANLAKRTITIDSNLVWGHFWYVANLGQATKLKGIFSGLSAISEVKKEFERMMRLDSNNVWVLNALGNYYLELPEVLGGDPNKALAILHRALTIDSTYSAIYLSLAKVYLKLKASDKALMYLNRMLTLKNPYPVADYLLEHKSQALKLLQELRRR